MSNEPKIEYIDRGQALEALRVADMSPVGQFYAGYYYGVLSEVPTVEAAPLVHSEWHKQQETKLTKTVECIRCNWSWRYKKKDGLPVESFSYCPMCGAKMDGLSFRRKNG